MSRAQVVVQVRATVAELVERRKAAGLTITDMVVKTGWAPATVRRFESGTGSPTLMQVAVYTCAIGGDWQRLLSIDEVFE